MSDIKDTREYLRPYVADMAAVEKHILEAVERQTKDEDFQKLPQAQQLVNRLETTLRNHVQTLEGHLAQFPAGGAAGAVKGAVTGVLGAFAGLYDKVRAEAASRGLRDDYTALNLASISYTMLHTSALALNETATAELALRNLKELTPLIMQLTEVLPEVVVRELAEEGKTYDASIVQRAIRATQEAWSTTAATVHA
jgi:ferritin-like metal-binding protein YciE